MNIKYLFYICLILLILYIILYYKEIENYQNLTNEVGDIINSLFNKNKTIFKDADIDNITVNKKITINNSKVNNLNNNEKTNINKLNVDTINNKNYFDFSNYSSFDDITINNDLNINRDIYINNINNGKIIFNDKLDTKKLSASKNLTLKGKLKTYAHDGYSSCTGKEETVLDINNNNNYCIFKK